MNIRDIYTQFKKDELLEIASELEISVPDGSRSSQITQAIIDDIEKEGVPETDDNTSDTLFQFLVVAEYIDEDGNLLEGKEEGTVSEELPKCFGIADDRDPSCNRCTVFDLCMKKRVESRPSCFGKLFERNDEQCKVCLEALPCSLITAKIQKKEN